MDLPVLFLWGLAIIVSLIVFLWVLRIVLKKDPYKFKMIFRTPGVDNHITVFGDSLTFTHEIDNKKYKIKAERLYRIKPGRVRKMLNRFRGIKEAFVIVYQDGKTEAVAPYTVKVSARILKEVSESRALDKALRSEFKVPWDLKKILMVIGFLVVAVIIWVVISGEVTL